MSHEISFIIKYKIQKLNHQESLEYQNHLCIASCIVYYHIKIIQAHHSQSQRQEPVADGMEACIYIIMQGKQRDSKAYQ